MIGMIILRWPDKFVALIFDKGRMYAGVQNDWCGSRWNRGR